MYVVLFFQTLYSFGSVFVVCELCERVTQGFNDINAIFSKHTYLSYPIEIQRLLPIMIIFTQQKVDFELFGSLTCSRESFEQVSSVNHFISPFSFNYTLISITQHFD